MTRKTQLLLLVVVICLISLRCWHLQADFSNSAFYSQEGSALTDEGFYTCAALHHFSLGHAYIPGGWNPGVFMPVWPLLTAMVFHFTGVSLLAARSLAVFCTWLGVWLAYAVVRQYRSRTFALVSTLLLASNALGFFFSRLAILEPAFVLFLLLAIYVSGKVRPGDYALAVVVGLIFVTLTLTKTTGPFVLPAVLYPIWAKNRESRTDAWKLLAVTLGTIFILMGGIKYIWAHHYAADLQVILGISPWWQITHSLPRLLRFFFRGTWVDPVLFPVALAGFLAATFWLRFFWRDPLFVLSFLWEAGYAAFIVFHYDGPPRYFVALIVPTLWLALVFMEWLWQEWRSTRHVLAAFVLTSLLWNLGFIANYLVHPGYTLVHAAVEAKQRIEADAHSNPLLIGRGADQIALLSDGLPSMDSDGAMPFAEKLETYQPGWYMQWSPSGLAGAPPAAKNFRFVESGRFSVREAHRDTYLFLYRIVPRQ